MKTEYCNEKEEELVKEYDKLYAELGHKLSKTLFKKVCTILSLENELTNREHIF